jgi:cell division protein FtsW (lipid II flippase)
MNGAVEVVLIAAVVVFVMARRLMGEPAVGKRLLLLPVILGVIGLTQASVHSVSAVVFLAASAALSVMFGLLRGLTIRTYEQNGIVMLRYTAMTIVLWVASIAARFAAGFVMNLIDLDAAQAGNGLMLVVGAGLLAEGLVVMSKAVRVRGQVVWSKGRRGEPHRSSAFLDSWQEKVHGNRHDSSR